MKKIPLGKVKAYRTKEDTAYNTQNVLITDYNFPGFVYEDHDWVSSVYHDRLTHKEWEEARKGKEGDVSLDHHVESWGHRYSQEDILAFCERLYNRPVDGYCIILFTNVSNGYPTYRIDAWKKGDHDKDDYTFDHIEYPKHTEYGEDGEIIYERWGF